MSIGVDLSHDSLRLARVLRSPDGSFQLMDYRLTPFQGNALPGTPSFIGFLRTVLGAFCGHSREFRLWTNLGSYHMNVRHLEVPKVPADQVADVVYWAFRREAPFDEAETLFDFEVEEEFQADGVSKLAVTGYAIPRRGVEEVKELFHRTGLPLTGVTLPVFAARNLFRTGWVPTDGKTVVYFFLGGDYSRGSIFRGGRFLLTRGIKSGLQTLLDSLAQAAGVPMSADQAQKLLFSISPGFPSLTDEDPGYRMSRDEAFQAMRPALDRLVRQVERTVEHYHLALKGERVDRIYVSGDMTACKPVMDYMAEQLGLEVVVMDPFERRNLSANLEPPSSAAERILFSQAVGLAVSDPARTPNLICTHKDRQRAVRGSRISRVMLGVAVILGILLLGVFVRELNSIKRSWDARARAREGLAQYDLQLSQPMVLSMVGQVQQKHSTFKDIVRRHMGVAAVGELCAVTPPEIRLGSIRAVFSPPGGSAGKDAVPRVELMGLVSGNRPSLEPALAAYVARLESSPLFEKVRVKGNTMEDYEGGRVLFFTIDMEFLPALGQSQGKGS